MHKSRKNAQEDHLDRDDDRLHDNSTVIGKFITLMHIQILLHFIATPANTRESLQLLHIHIYI